MASDLNQVTLIGRLTRDPELRQIPSGQSVCNFGIANNRTYVSNGSKREEVSFFNCVAWGRLAEIINQYCQKGKQIAVSGRLKQDSYDDKEGRKVNKVEIVVENMQLLGRPGDGGSGVDMQPASSMNEGWPQSPDSYGSSYGNAPQQSGSGIPPQFQPASSVPGPSGSQPGQKNNQFGIDDTDIPF